LLPSNMAFRQQTDIGIGIKISNRI